MIAQFRRIKKIFEEKTASQTPASTKQLISNTQNSLKPLILTKLLSSGSRISNTQNSLKE
jgi:hypothetical protein